MQIQSNERIFIAGKTGSGKSILAKYLIQGYNRYVYHDPKYEHNIGEVFATTPNELIEALKKYNKILYRPKDLGEDDFNEICRIVYYSSITLIIDEASLYTTPYNIPEWTRNLMVRGRSANSGVISLSQRPNGCNNLLISESEHVFIFKLNLDGDIQKLKIVIPKRYHNDLYEIPQYHYIYAGSYTGVKLCKPLAIHI